MKKEMNKFKRLRLLEGLTAKQVAEHLDIPLKVYYYYESGTRSPNVKRLKAIADFYGVSMEELLD